MMSRNRDEYGAIWGRCPLPGAEEELDGLGLAPTDDLYSDVYDEDGNEVLCDICGSEVKWREEDGAYVCLGCGQVFTRADFFNFIGAEPPGKECYTCDCLYPGCMTCPYGYGEL